jgi:two-component system LytT family sensor kinase
MKRRNIILIHLLFWAVRFTPDFTGSSDQWLFIVSFFGISITTFYLNYLLVMPLLFAKRKYILAFAGWVFLLGFFISARYLVEEVLYLKWFGVHNYHEGTRLPYYIADNIFYAIPVLTFSGLLWLIIGYVIKGKENAGLQAEKSKAELNFLKSQVNPHFLFNNLNNIYSLVYQKSDKALPVIQKLSDMMRFMMRDSTLDLIPLEEELKYVQDLIDLQTLRVAGTASVNYRVTGRPEGKFIAPLLLIPFVENGFKHGSITDKEHPFLIDIQISEKGLEFYSQNKIAKGSKDATSGIGLANLKRRLEMQYPKAHTLACYEEGDIYICKLNIQFGQ